ncbi:MAG: hypothetical protein IT340_14895 [Chloroflexi bacterium]|nr:hypothetical protein [Chloroflexota bacterium]
MADEVETLSLERAKERVLEDERLRSDLADDEAQVLLDWALTELDAAANRGEPVEAAVDRVRAQGHEINEIVGQRYDLAPAVMAARLRRLAGLPDPAPPSFWSRWFGNQQRDAVDDLLARQETLSGPDLVSAVLALLPAMSESTS